MGERRYRSNPAKVSLREWRRLRSGTGLLLPLAIKLFRLPFPRNEVVLPSRVVPFSAAELPEAVRRGVSPTLSAVEVLGFSPRLCLITPSTVSAPSWSTVLVHRDGTVVASVAAAYHPATGRSNVAVSFGSLTASGLRLGTVGAKGFLDLPPGFEDEYHPGVPVAELLEIHRRRLAEKGPPVALSAEQLVPMLEERTERWIAFHVARGTYSEVKGWTVGI
jgi:hypothetical protein